MTKNISLQSTHAANAGLCKGQRLELTITALALGGKAIARMEDEVQEDGTVRGRVIFIDKGLPDQRVLVELTTVKKRFAEAKLIKILDVGPHTREAHCPHFGACGGCTWQDLPYESQLFWKERFVRDVLGRIGNQTELPMLPIIASPQEFGFRNKMEFAFGTDAQGNMHLGLRQRSSHDIIDVTDCKLQSPLAQKIVNVARQLCSQSKLPAWNDIKHTGFWRFLVIREPAFGKQCVAHLITSQPQGSPEQAAKAAAHAKANPVWGKKRRAQKAISAPVIEATIADFGKALMEAVPEISGFSHAYRTENEQVAQGQGSDIHRGKSNLREKIGQVTLGYGPSSFFQTNTPATELLYAEVARMAALTGREEVWDLYCGVGSITLYLAPMAKNITGMELSKASIEWAKRNATAMECPTCTFEAGDVRQNITKRRPRPNVVVLDPPRAGLHPQVIEILCKKRPSRIVYVSCDPATLARDIALFANDYEVAEVRPVDLFPQTAHVETVVLLRRRLPKKAEALHDADFIDTDKE